MNTGVNHDNLRTWLSGFCINFEPPLLPLQFCSRLSVTRPIWAPSDLKVDECLLCFRGSSCQQQTNSVSVMLLTCTHRDTQYKLLQLPFVHHNTSQGWLLFCLSSIKSFSHHFHCSYFSYSATTEDEIVVESVGQISPQLFLITK